VVRGSFSITSERVGPRVSFARDSAGYYEDLVLEMLSIQVIKVPILYEVNPTLVYNNLMEEITSSNTVGHTIHQHICVTNIGLRTAKQNVLDAMKGEGVSHWFLP